MYLDIQVHNQIPVSLIFEVQVVISCLTGI